MIYVKFTVLLTIMALTSFYFIYEKRRVKQYMHFFFPFVYIALINLVFFTDYIFLGYGAVIIILHGFLIYGCNRNIGTLNSNSNKLEGKKTTIQEGLDFTIRNKQKVLYGMIFILIILIVAIFLFKF